MRISTFSYISLLNIFFLISQMRIPHKHNTINKRRYQCDWTDERRNTINSMGGQWIGRLHNERNRLRNNNVPQQRYDDNFTTTLNVRRIKKTTDIFLGY